MRILIVGDSQAEGPVGRGVQSALQQTGHTVERIAYQGHGAYDWTRIHWPEYQAALGAFRPDQVILIFGSNDAPNANLESAMRTFKASAPKVYYAGPPRYDRRPDVQVLSAGIRGLASRVFGVDHLDAWPYTGTAVPRAADGLHFTSSGGAVWADGILRRWSAAARGSTATLNWLGPALLAGSAAAAAVMFWWGRR